MNETAARPDRWADAWPDALAFAAGLALAWFFQWETRDLVWSLWLSSLLVGFAMILWSIFAPALLLAREGRAAAALAMALGGTALVAFFAVHFGMFHYVHSVFLNAFFPVTGRPEGFPGPEIYAEVVARYWWFVPVALLAERQAFKLASMPPEPPKFSGPRAEIAQRVAGMARFAPLNDIMGPYKNVIRLHLLIFFFAGAHFLQLDSFLVYAVVYAVYFFPWRLVRREKPATGA